MLVELVGLELCEAVYAFWLYSDGLVLLVLGKDCLRIFAGMFLDESFEPHWLLPLFKGSDTFEHPVQRDMLNQTHRV
jgi:hypothetical protein